MKIIKSINIGGDEKKIYYPYIANTRQVELNVKRNVFYRALIGRFTRLIETGEKKINIFPQEVLLPLFFKEREKLGISMSIGNLEKIIYDSPAIELGLENIPSEGTLNLDKPFKEPEFGINAFSLDNKEWESLNLPDKVKKILNVFININEYYSVYDINEIFVNKFYDPKDLFACILTIFSSSGSNSTYLFEEKIKEKKFLNFLENYYVFIPEEGKACKFRPTAINYFGVSNMVPELSFVYLMNNEIEEEDLNVTITRYADAVYNRMPEYLKERFKTRAIDALTEMVFKYKTAVPLLFMPKEIVLSVLNNVENSKIRSEVLYLDKVVEMFNIKPGKKISQLISKSLISMF